MMKRCFVAIIFILLITGCQTAPQVQQTQAATFAPEVTGAYPAQSLLVEENTSYPIATQSSAPYITPTPEAGTGKVTGTLMLNDKPVKNILLYLGTFLKNSEGVEYTAVVEPAFSPQAYTDVEGKFTFFNVKPGRYTLVLDNVTNQFLLLKPGTQDHFTIEVTPEGIVDLGEMIYDELPIPPTE